jgi:two-component system cell cycle sensor histidine kinase/response regulator CckA
MKDGYLTREELVRELEDLRRRVVELETADVRRSKAEEALDESEQRYRTLADTSPDAIVVVDLSSLIIMVNHRTVVLNGATSREDLIGKNAFDLIAPEDRQRAIEDLKRVRREGHVDNLEYRLLTKSGEVFPAELNIAMMTDEAGEPTAFIAAIRDMRERRRAEAERAQLQEQFRQAQKMEAIGRLAGGVAHDFNNLLFVVLNYSAWLREALGAESSLRPIAEQIEKAALRGAALARKLLAFSRRTTVRPQVVDINRLMTDLSGMLRTLLGEDITMTHKLTTEPAHVLLDRGHLEQAIMNLAVNAKDAMPDGGQVTIETIIRDIDPEYSRTHIGVASGRYIQLTVSDNGCGMGPDVRERLFEPFFTTKKESEGTGLGLSATYGIIRQAGGHIWVESEVGQGSTFTILLPWVNAGDEVVEQQKPIPVRTPAGETVLLVEDDVEVRSLTLTMLEREGYRVLEARDGLDACRIAKEHDGPIHVLLTDVIMPDMNGKQLADNVRALRPDSVVLYMSGYTDEVITQHGIIDRGASYIQKPFGREELMYKIAELLSTPASP